MNKVKIGVVGLGNMGSGHLRYLNDLPEAELIGVCDTTTEKADKFAAQYNTTAYYSYMDFFCKANLDAVIIAVPHFDHEPIAIEAFNRGISVMCEKPITVHVNGAKRMLAAYEEAKKKTPKILFGMMFQERTIPFYKKLKDLISCGELGRLTRATWINTAWFRSQAYYDSGGWRATWAGEGGGILTNQCPHNLDTYNWLFGLPKQVNGFAYIGKYHNIEVEDEVTAFMEHENGLTSHFIVTTGECPGTNRFEIVGENGTLVYQDDKIVFYKNRMSMLKYSNETKQGFSAVENWETHIPVDMNQPIGHRVVTEKFLKSIITGKEDMIATGWEGLNPVMLANGIMLSSFNKTTVEFPLDGDLYEKKLKELAIASKYQKKVNENVDDFKKSLTGNIN
jgi:predicted dehydrogenase